MTVPFMRAYTELLVKTCHRRGAHAMGGMAAFIPSRRNPEINETALARVREDKERESGDGFDGTWVAHPDLVPVATEVFDAALGERPNQVQRQREEVQVSAARAAGLRGAGGRRHRSRRAGQRLRRHPVHRVLAAGRRGGRDQQPDGGRRDGGDLPLPDLAVAAEGGHPGRQRRPAADPRPRPASGAGGAGRRSARPWAKRPTPADASRRPPASSSRSPSPRTSPSSSPSPPTRSSSAEHADALWATRRQGE